MCILYYPNISLMLSYFSIGIKYIEERFEYQASFELVILIIVENTPVFLMIFLSTYASILGSHNLDLFWLRKHIKIITCSNHLYFNLFHLRDLVKS